MTKREFLEELKEALSEQLPQNQVAEHVSYYMNYIEERKRSGSSEDEVLDMLGDPRLIARTILDTTPGSRENQNYFYEETTQDVQSEEKKKGLSGKAKKYVYIGIAIAVILLIIYTPLEVPHSSPMRDFFLFLPLSHNGNHNEN